MSLVLRRILIDTWHENVAYMHRDCEIYRAEGFQALSKVAIHANGRQIMASLNVVDDISIVAPGELGLSKVAFGQIGVDEGYRVSVSQAEPPESIGALRRKLSGDRIELEDFRAIARDISGHRLSKIELTAF
ncbi:MAG TPA: thymidine phosphorylase, partial [Terriglobia bacterium]|nr:thymidine phosphorylase [Terriglobia bacterium]